MSKKVAIGLIMHETNCFSPIQMPLSGWKERLYQVKQEILEKNRGLNNTIGGFIHIAEREGWELIPTIAAWAVPSGPTDAATYAHLKELLLEPLRNQKVDAVLMAMHGAMMAEDVDDPELDLVLDLRKIIGDIPLISTFDLHANVQKEMVENLDGVFGFDTNPHVDYFERAVEAAELLTKMFKDNLKPKTAFNHPPMMPPTINMRTDEGPIVRLFDKARDYELMPGVYNVSVFGGFPYVDAPYTGLSVVATADDREKAQKICDEIGALAWEHRNEFLKQLYSVSSGMDKAESIWDDADPRPIILADSSDNPGGGGSGDAPELLREIVKRNLSGSVAALIWDPETVQEAIRVGIGNTGKFRIGGKISKDFGPPVEVEAYVATISDGKFRAYGPMTRGGPFNTGTAVRLVAGNVQILVGSIRVQCNETDILRNLGVNPERERLIMVKSRGHFRADFQPFAKDIIEVNAPGAVSQDLALFPFKRANCWPLNQ